MTSNKIAIWAGVSAFFSSIAVICLINAFNPKLVINIVGAFVFSLTAALSAYARHRYLEATKEKDEIM
jgi:hypothetical protein